MTKTLKFLLVILIFSACMGTTQNSGDPVVYAEENDPELEQARQDALANLDDFLSLFEKYKTDTTKQFSIKTDFVENGEHEHMWVSVVESDSSHFRGYLGNDPQIVSNVSYGDWISVEHKDIEDWIIYHTLNDSMQGGYSVKVFQSREQ